MGKAMTETAFVPVPQSTGAAVSVQDVAQALVSGRLPDAPMQMPTQRLIRPKAQVSFLRALFFGPLGPVGT